MHEVRSPTVPAVILSGYAEVGSNSRFLITHPTIFTQQISTRALSSFLLSADREIIGMDPKDDYDLIKHQLQLRGGPLTKPGVAWQPIANGWSGRKIVYALTCHILCSTWLQR